MEYYKIINKAIAEKYGKSITGDPIYRLTQNQRNLTEKRRGIFNIFYGHIFIRTEKGVKEVPKYNYIDDGIWILEKFDYTNNPELATKSSYEPIYVFTDPLTGGYQRPNMRAVMLLCKWNIEKATNPVETENERIEREAKEFFEALGGKPGLDMAFTSGEAVSYAGLDAKEKF